MNVIVSNKQKNILDNANIDAIKELNGLFNVDELINNFKGYFFSKIIIDATSVVDFAKEEVLKKLASGIGAEKIVLLLPEKPEPPKRFCDFLESLGIHDYSTNISDIVNYFKKNNDVSGVVGDINNHDFYDTSSNISGNNTMPKSDNIDDVNHDKKIVLGFKNVTLHAGSTSLVYMIKECLEKKYKISVEAYELGGGNFRFFNSSSMYDISIDNLHSAIQNSKSNVILLDLNNNDCSEFCDDIIYLIEPSILKINKLLFENRDIFSFLNNKKVVLNKCMLSSDEVIIFGKEAGIDIYYSIPYVNDRIENKVIEDFINKLGIVHKDGQGLLGLFNKDR